MSGPQPVSLEQLKAMSVASLKVLGYEAHEQLQQKRFEVSKGEEVIAIIKGIIADKQREELEQKQKQKEESEKKENNNQTKGEKK